MNFSKAENANPSEKMLLGNSCQGLNQDEKLHPGLRNEKSQDLKGQKSMF